jgi:hypothetical protein
VNWACRLFGHQPTFCADGATMRWACGRCGGATGAKIYDSAEQAHRYAAAFNKRDVEDVGTRAPLIALLPLRLWRRFRSG